MNPLKTTIVPIFSISAGLVVSVLAFGFRDADPLDANATDAVITTLTSRILEDSQIAHLKLDDTLAIKFLDRYIDTLDSGHMVFLQSDIEEFSSHLMDLAKDIRDEGDSTLAHIVFKRYLERLDQRVTYITKMLQT